MLIFLESRTIHTKSLLIQTECEKNCGNHRHGVASRFSCESTIKKECYTSDKRWKPPFVFTKIRTLAYVWNENWMNLMRKKKMNGRNSLATWPFANSSVHGHSTMLWKMCMSKFLYANATTTLYALFGLTNFQATVAHILKIFIQSIGEKIQPQQKQE